jgi:hypothetical protein
MFDICVVFRNSSRAIEFSELDRHLERAAETAHHRQDVVPTRSSQSRRAANVSDPGTPHRYVPR